MLQKYIHQDTNAQLTHNKNTVECCHWLYRNNNRQNRECKNTLL